MTAPGHGAVNALVESVLPYDGPHDPEQVTTAVAVMAGLARNLANATLAGASLPTPPDVDRAVGDLNETLRSLAQVVAYIGTHLHAMGGDARLRADRHGDGAGEAVCAVAALGEAAGDLRRAGGHLHRAFGHTSRLYFDDL